MFPSNYRRAGGVNKNPKIQKKKKVEECSILLRPETTFRQIKQHRRDAT